MTSLTPRIDKVERVVHGSVINTPLAAVPYTTILNEHGQARQIPDLSQNMKVSIGVERIPFLGISKLTKEFGPNGECVSELTNKDARVRFVGPGWSLISNGNGAHIGSTTLNDFCEIAFFGTGLNLLLYQDSSAVGSCLVKVDDGAESANVAVISSSVLNARSYTPNRVVNVARALTLGWHTVKLRVGTASTLGLLLSGVEVVNAATALTINPGKPFFDEIKRIISTQQTIAYKPSAMTGTKGGRVVTYQDFDGTIKQAYTEVPSSPSYLTSASHLNEEIDRTINFREFGANRADDFSTLAGSNSTRAYTLDDGVTALMGSTVVVDSPVDALRMSGGGTWTFTFVGVGLDIVRQDNANGSGETNSVTIDGVAAGNISSIGSTAKRVEKLCSGLPYGTHTVKLTQVSGGSSFNVAMHDFIIYKPKKPSIPTDALELADDCVLADFVKNTTTGISKISNGVIAKNNTRNLVYILSWTASLDVAIDVGGWLITNPSGTNTGSEIRNSFFGTGFELIGRSQSNSGMWDIYINGVLATTANFPGLTASETSGLTKMNLTTGRLDLYNAADLYGYTISLSGLPLSHYNVSVVGTGLKNASSSNYYLSFNGMNIITPIYHSDPNLGNLSLLDMRQDPQIEGTSEKIDLSKAKALLIYDTTSLKMLGGFGISQVLRTATGAVIVYFSKKFKDNNYIAIASSSSYCTYVEYASQTPNKAIIKQTDAGATATEGIFRAAFFGELENESNE